MRNSFTGTVQLTPALLASLKAGTATLKTGQWVKGMDGRRGQFLGADLRAGSRIVAVCWMIEGESFEDRTQRFARALWHRRHKHEPVTAVIHAPASIDIDRLKEHFRTTFAQAA